MQSRSGIMARPVAAHLGVATALLVTFAGMRAAVAEELEYRVKAEFIERFTHFIEWPPSAFPSPTSPFFLCVVGETPMTSYLAALARRRRIKDRPVVLQTLKPAADLSACHLVFIGADERPYLKKILDGIDGLPIVTVADSEGFGRAGVLINLLLDAQGRVGFEISSSGTKHGALLLKAQLLRLSRSEPAP